MLNNGKRICWAVMRLLLAALLLSAARPAQAEVLQVRLDFFGEEPVAELCLVTTLSSVPKAQKTSWSELGKQRSATAAAGSAGDAAARDSCAAEVTPPSQPSSLPLYESCIVNQLHGGKGQAVLYLGGVLVSEAKLDVDVLRIVFSVDRGNPDAAGAPVDIQLRGGDYYPNVPLPFRQVDNSLRVDLPLVPRCVTREISVPNHSCAEHDAAGVPQLTGAVATGPSELNGRRFEARVANGVEGRGSVSVEHCGHRFEAAWSGRVPPRPLALTTTDFFFEWERTCLAPKGICPTAQVEGVVGGPEVPLPSSETSGDSFCHYVVNGSPTFPVRVRFSFHEDKTFGPDKTKEIVTTSWLETLNSPGLRLFGFIPEEQRRVTLNWPWMDKHPGRASWQSDEISEAEIRTPEGSVRSVPAGSEQIRIPELSCRDHVSYRYVGARFFKIVPTRVGEDGAITLEEPSNFRTGNLTLGAAVGAGWRVVSAGSPTNLGPQVGFEAIVVVRSFRDWLQPVTALDLEFRAGGIYALQPYCSRLLQPGDAPVCQRDDWHLIPFWRIPITAGFNLHSFHAISFGAALGIAPTLYNFASDMNRVDHPTLLAMRFHLGYQINRTFSLEGYLRVFRGERVRTTLFDEAGVNRSGTLGQASTWSEFPGFALRVDDLL